MQPHAERGHEVEQGGRLVANLVHERRCDPVPDHALARYSHDRDGALATARNPRPRSANRGARAAREVADGGCEELRGSLQPLAAPPGRGAWTHAHSVSGNACGQMAERASSTPVLGTWNAYS
jgi:hypothetical protein